MSDEKTIDDGGPAYSRPGVWYIDMGGLVEIAPTVGGMSLRAWLAGQALSNRGFATPIELRDTADLCVMAADAIIERLKR